MSAHERIGAAISAANKAGRPALVPFITAGYPEPKEFVDTLKAVASVGDVVELGIPFSDPMADGMTIQRSSFIALQKGVSLRWIFDQLDSIRDEMDTPLVMMSYLNPLLAFGYDALAERALAAGVCGFIVPDLPFEESDDLRAALEANGLGLIQLVTPATPDERLKKLCEASRGFVYAVTITGITGGGTGLPADLTDYLRFRDSRSCRRCGGRSARGGCDRWLGACGGA
jgi:tryptophan synthase alpha chain